jgi:hypothetical protein
MWSAGTPDEEEDLAESDRQILQELEASAKALETGLVQLREEKEKAAEWAPDAPGTDAAGSSVSC